MRPDARLWLPFLGAADRRTLARLLPRLSPWAQPDLAAALAAPGGRRALAAALAAFGQPDAPPLSPLDFERAVRSRQGAYPRRRIGFAAASALASRRALRLFFINIIIITRVIVDLGAKTLVFIRKRRK